KIVSSYATFFLDCINSCTVIPIGGSLAPNFRAVDLRFVGDFVDLARNYGVDCLRRGGDCRRRCDNRVLPTYERTVRPMLSANEMMNWRFQRARNVPQKFSTMDGIGATSCHGIAFFTSTINITPVQKFLISTLSLPLIEGPLPVRPPFVLSLLPGPLLLIEISSTVIFVSSTALSLARAVTFHQ
uniref:Uncharacterized protein n=1 Tax=Romanomermis culicivorax TaxID=13658 RepID=A0A915IEY8_ROMCU